MVGVLAKLYMFGSGRDVERFARDIKGKAGSRVEYSWVNLNNKEYNLNVRIKLLAEASVKRVSRLTEIGEEYYRFRIDIPVQHMSLEGEWRVKEARTVDMVLFEEEGLETVALALSDRKDVYRYFEQALPHFSRVRVSRAILDIRDPRVVEELSRSLGEIQWIYLSDIKDPRVTQAMFRGRRLEESEIVASLYGIGRVSGLIIYDRERRLRITLGGSGSIYTPKQVTAPDLAKSIAPTLRFLVERGVLTRKP